MLKSVSDLGVKKFAQGAFRILTLFLIFPFFSCSTKASSLSIVNQFDTVDALISQNQNKDALKELKKISKKVYESWSYIGIYKRYKILDEKKLSEQILLKGLKRNPKNPELSAVYTKFLLEENRISEAEKISEVLQKTRYASIYAECVFKSKLQNNLNNEKSLLYEDGKYFDLFADSYEVSKNPVWLRNCAVVHLVKGRYDAASDLTPSAFNDSDDAYFWAQVNFDGGRYVQAANACEASLYFLESLKKSSSLFASEIKVSALESDSYFALADSASAHLVRDRILCHYITGEDLYSDLSQDEKDLLPIVIVNSALEEKKLGNDDRSCELLSYSVMNFPFYVPGLISYAEFAYESNLGRREDDEILALRNVGLKTLEMERYDSRAKIPLSDAFFRIDQALMQVNDPYLYITRLDLKYKTDPSLSVRNKTADLWKLLEASSTETKKYHDILVLYIVNFLLENGMYSDAETIFKKYISSKYELDPKVDFFEQISDKVRHFDVADLEVSAYFALNQKYTDEALRIYEYCVFESAGSRGGEVSPKVSSETAMNLANLYYGIAAKEKSLDLYGKTASRETLPNMRAEAFYRIATIYFAFGETQNALRSADYACSIYPEHARAHLLKTKILSKQ